MNEKISIIGAGNSGLTMAAFFAKYNHKVKLWNRTFKNIEQLKKEKFITITGAIEGKFQISQISEKIEKALKNVDWIFITTPANSHKSIILEMSDYLMPNSIIVLSPGRTFGIIEAEKVLKLKNKKNLLAESQTIIFTCRKTDYNKVNLIELKENVLLSAKNTELTDIIFNKLPDCMKKYYKPAKNYLQTSLGNVGMILHCLPLLLNVGWVETKRTKFKYYYEGITPSIAGLLEKLDNERLLVAKKLNLKVDSLIDWFKRSYLVDCDNIYECIRNTTAYNNIDAPKTINHRYLLEDVATGLVPLEYLAKQLGLKLKTTNLIIDLASEILNFDFREKGRKIDIQDII